MNKLRIALIAPQPFVETRGTSIANLRLAQALAGDGHGVDVITYPFGADLAQTGIRIHRCAGPPLVRAVKVGFSAAKMILDANLASYAIGVSRAIKPDVFHGVEEGVFIAALLSSLHRKPFVYDMDSVMSYEIECGRLGRFPLATRAMLAGERWAINRCSLVMTISRSMADYVRGVNPHRQVAIVPDVPISSEPESTVSDVVRELADTKGRRLVMYTGSFAHYQGLELLVSAIEAVRSEVPEALFVIVGGNQDEISRLRSEAKSLGVVHKLLFLGKRPPGEIPSLLRAADVLVSPRRGGINPPAKIYSYMQSGRPSVLTDIPAHTTIVGADAAVLTPVDPRGISDGIVWALTHPVEAEAKASRARELAMEYTPELQTRRILDAYDRVSEMCAERAGA